MLSRVLINHLCSDQSFDKIDRRSKDLYNILEYGNNNCTYKSVEK